jgi:hypothetical protein
MEDFIYDSANHALLRRDGSPIAWLDESITGLDGFNLADCLNGTAQLELESRLVEQHNRSVLLESRLQDMEDYSRGLVAEINQLSDKNYD